MSKCKWKLEVGSIDSIHTSILFIYFTSIHYFYLMTYRKIESTLKYKSKIALSLRKINSSNWRHSAGWGQSVFFILNIHFSSCQIRMGQNLSSFDSIFRVKFQHSSKKIHSFRIDIFVNWRTQVEFQLFVIIVNLFTFFSFEKWSSNQKNVENGSKWENIAFWLNVLSFY